MLPLETAQHLVTPSNILTKLFQWVLRIALNKHPDSFYHTHAISQRTRHSRYSNSQIHHTNNFLQYQPTLPSATDYSIYLFTSMFIY